MAAALGLEAADDDRERDGVTAGGAVTSSAIDDSPTVGEAGMAKSRLGRSICEA